MWPNPQETADLVTFTEETFYGKLHFLYDAALSKSLLFNVELNLVYLNTFKELAIKSSMTVVAL